MDLVLTPAEVGKFQEALLSAFNRSELEQLVYLRLEVDLNDVVADGPHRQVVFDLIKWANGQGKIETLLHAAREENSGNVLLRQFDDSHPGALCTASAHDASCHENSAKPVARAGGSAAAGARSRGLCTAQRLPGGDSGHASPRRAARAACAPIWIRWSTG